MDDQAQLLSRASMAQSPWQHHPCQGHTLPPPSFHMMGTTMFLSGKSYSLEGDRLWCQWLQWFSLGFLGNHWKEPSVICGQRQEIRMGSPGPSPSLCWALLFNQFLRSVFKSRSLFLNVGPHLHSPLSSNGGGEFSAHPWPSATSWGSFRMSATGWLSLAYVSISPSDGGPLSAKLWLVCFFFPHFHSLLRPWRKIWDLSS